MIGDRFLVCYLRVHCLFGIYMDRVAKYCYNILIYNKIVAILLGGFRNFSYLCI